MKRANSTSFEQFPEIKRAKKNETNEQADIIMSSPDKISGKIKSDDRPTDYEYAFLSNHVYDGPSLAKDQEIQILDTEWRIEEILADQACGFFGAIYKNLDTHHLVVAYRGTDLMKSDRMRALMEDLYGIYHNQELSPQKEKAFELTKKAVSMAKKDRLPLSFTGHSLGAYLAELSVWYAHCYCAVADNVNSVTFESPGTYDIIEQLQSSLSHARIKLKKLDMITYLSYPNLINTCNRQAATVYGLAPFVGNWANLAGWHLKQVHSMSNILQLFEEADGNRIGRHYMLDWPQGNQREKYFRYARLEAGRYRLPENIDDEFEFVIGAHFQYDIHLGGWQILPLRHFSRSMQNWLNRFYKEVLPYTHNEQFLLKVKEELSRIGVLNEVAKYLLPSMLKRHPEREIVYFETPADIPVTEVRRELSGWIAKNTKKTEDIFKVLDAKIEQIPDIQARFFAPGAILDVEGEVECSMAEAVHVYIPVDTDPELANHFQQISKNFLKNIKAAGITVSAEFAAPGAIIKGKIRNCRAYGVSFNVAGPIDIAERIKTISLAGDSPACSLESKASSSSAGSGRFFHPPKSESSSPLQAQKTQVGGPSFSNS